MRRVKLKDVAEITGGSTPKTKVEEYWNGDIVWLSPTDLPEIGEITTISDSARKITEEGLNSCSAKLLPVGTVIFSSRASIGKIGINEVPVATNQGFINFICDENIYNRYLTYTLKYFTDDIVQLSNSTTFKEVSRTAIKNFEIPLPSLSEQKAIVAKLDRAQRLIDIDREMLAKYDELIQSVFLEMFGDPVRNEKGWERKPMNEIGELKSGGTPSRKNKEYFTGDIDWYTTGELESIYLGDAEEKITEAAIDESSAKLFEKGSLLIGMYDTSAFKLGILTRQASSNQASANIFLNEEICNVEWLYYCLKIMRPSILHERRGIRQKNLTLGFLKKLEIIMPPLIEQLQFSKSLNHISEEKKTTELIAKESEELFSSLVQGVFG